MSDAGGVYQNFTTFGKGLSLVVNCLSTGESKVLDVVVSDYTHVYRAGPSVVFLRLPQGSAIVTTVSQKG